MEYFDNSKPRGFDSYLELVEKLEFLRDAAWKSLERGEIVPGRHYRRGLRELKGMLKYAIEESLRRSGQNPEPI